MTVRDDFHGQDEHQHKFGILDSGVEDFRNPNMLMGVSLAVGIDPSETEEV